MTDIKKPWLDELVESQFGRICLVIGTTLVTTSISPIIFLMNKIIAPLAIKIVVVLAIGIVAGLSARILMAKSTWWFKFILTCTSILLGLWLLAILTMGYAGIPFHHSNRINLQEITQFGTAALPAWLVLQAWRQPQPPKKPSVKQPQKSARQLQTRSLAIKIKPPSKKKTKASLGKTPNLSGKKLTISMRRWLAKGDSLWKGYTQDAGLKLQRMSRHIQKALNPTRKWAKNSLSTLRTQLTRQKLVLSSSMPKLRQVKTKQSQASNKSIIRLTGAEEHRCPYCLEIVQENDARGVQVCPICGTFHHADCWAITGVCQVPHHHE